MGIDDEDLFMTQGIEIPNEFDVTLYNSTRDNLDTIRRRVKLYSGSFAQIKLRPETIQQRNLFSQEVPPQKPIEGTLRACGSNNYLFSIKDPKTGCFTNFKFQDILEMKI